MTIEEALKFIPNCPKCNRKITNLGFLDTYLCPDPDCDYIKIKISKKGLNFFIKNNSIYYSWSYSCNDIYICIYYENGLRNEFYINDIDFETIIKIIKNPSFIKKYILLK